jgi:ABC-type multidrug transport system fused ATPase/permease subunit
MFLRSLLFSHAEKLISIGKNRVIQSDDRLLPLEDGLSPRSIPWDESKIDWSNKKTFLVTLLKASRKNFAKAISFQITGSIFSFATPFVVHAFVSRLQTGTYSESDLLQLCLIAVSFGLCGICNGISIQHYFYQTLVFNQIATNLVNKKIFQHSLKLSSAGKNKYQVGDIVNFMGTDSEAIADGCITTIDLSNSIVMSLSCTAALFYFLGWSAIVAVIVMAILIPVTGKLSKSFMHLEDEMMAHRDKRLTLMTQLLNAMRVVKYFVWEKSVHHEVSEVRAKEVAARTKLAYAEIAWGLVYTSVNSVVLFSALLTHVLRGKTVDMALIFTCISIFGIMEDQFGALSRFISRFINILVSADRITKFLQSETLEEKPHAAVSQGAVEFKNVDFYFDENKKVISNLNLKLMPGQSLAVLGAVGSGKSTLLSLLLDEYFPKKGEILFNKSSPSRAYVPQDAYIVNGSLRENIIFGKKGITEDDIKRALKLSALEFDLLALPAGLETEIGEKGVNLSGGQKQRVSIARAILADTDLIFLDDPLSALDPNTENYLNENLLFGEWKNKTRVMVTHRLGAVSRFDLILFLDDGRHYLGTFDELMISCENFKRFVRTYEENAELEKKSGIKKHAAEMTQSSGGSDSGKLIVDEDRAIGAVEKSVYVNYLKALGGKPPKQKRIIALLFVAAIAIVSAPLLQKVWLSQSDKITDLTPLQVILIYGALGLVTMAVTYIGNSFWARRGIEAGKSFHDQMLSSILAAPIRFFDSTPVGRILQRFSRDVESVDIYLQWSFDNTIHSLFHVTVSFLLIVTVLPVVIIFMIPIFFIYYNLQNSYRRVAREIKRLDSLARSPRYAHFKETLQGLSVIRAFGQKEWAMEQFYSKLHYSAEMSRTHYMVNRWFSTRLPVIGAAISATTGLVIVFSSYKGLIGAGTAGLVTLYALDFWRHLNWGVRIFSDLESRMTSVERLQFYCDLPAEKNFHGHDALDVGDHWPETGNLEFKNVYLKYAPHLPFVLKNVSFKIPSGSRVGLIGRTGSGKSTIFQSVYRFVDIESGEILLDGQPIHRVPLKRVRKSLAVIPQDPSLFMGTLRSNIDRYNQVADEEVWEVLKKVSLEQFVKHLPNQLEFRVAENGANLSQGQRQLICLARALLMKVKIIFLDEATASVDVETDAVVQRVIRDSLDGMTLITIAHRLSTLEGYDKIIELSNGEVVSPEQHLL